MQRNFGAQSFSRGDLAEHTSTLSCTARYCCQVPFPSSAPQPAATTFWPILNLFALGPISTMTPTPALKVSAPLWMFM